MNKNVIQPNPMVSFFPPFPFSEEQGQIISAQNSVLSRLISKKTNEVIYAETIRHFSVFVEQQNITAITSLYSSLK